MADLLDGIARYLQSLGLVMYDPDGVTGDTFIDTMPPAPDSAVALGAYGLGPPDPLNDDDESGLQIRARGGPDPRVSRRRCMAIYSALHGLAGVELPDGNWLILCTAQQTPSPLGTDDVGRHEHVVNFRLNIVNPTANRT
ncbi:minor capsid protein [Kitasatospora sp. NPDC050543]|uniref:minor capsid protein n=1 Tax=Kitasatospora sp. NPDC050543 TaxID=3364054 RepID=UPI003793DF33